MSNILTKYRIQISKDNYEEYPSTTYSLEQVQAIRNKKYPSAKIKSIQTTQTDGSNGTGTAVEIVLLDNL